MNKKEIKFIDLITDLITHEFKTPINTISGFSEILSSNMSLEESKRKEYLKLINEQSHYLALITDCIIDLGKMELENFRIMKNPVIISDLLKKKIQKLNRLNSTDFIIDKLNLSKQINVDERKILGLVELLLIHLKKIISTDEKIEITDIETEKHLIFKITLNTKSEEKELLVSKLNKEGEINEISHENPTSIYWIKRIMKYHNGILNNKNTETGIEIEIKLLI
ncbi:MAG TPA: histidine kinase dimerization/phospho-acceptor domain-containing protein [Ignavibacteria bacterium]|nr:histidine kinase dimerization/phospho-acceptor domain-containing protein [Ignavibacteria bacterium]